MREFIATRLPRLRMIEPEGTYLVWVDFRRLGLDNDALEDLVLHKANLWLDSGAIFGPVGEGFQRFNIACPRATPGPGVGTAGAGSKRSCINKAKGPLWEGTPPQAGGGESLEFSSS